MRTHLPGRFLSSALALVFILAGGEISRAQAQAPASQAQAQTPAQQAFVPAKTAPAPVPAAPVRAAPEPGRVMRPGSIIDIKV